MNYNLKQLTNKQLDFINERVISPDKHMFEIKAAGGGFNTEIASKIIDFILANCTTFNKDSVVLIINDFSLHMTKALIEYGIPAEHIKLVFCRFSGKKEIVVDDKTLTRLFRLHPVLRQNKELEIISWKEVEQMEFDGIIANPPYGAIGANITKKIIDTVKFIDYINLLPANDYKRNAGKDLFNYQSNMEAINDGFADAAVTTHIARIHKDKVNNMTLDEFERSQYIDRQLDKYFAENSKRSHYAIDNHICKPKIARFRTIDLRKCFYTGKRDLAAGHLPYSKDTMSYKINFNLLTDHDEFLANSSKSEQALGNSGNYTVVPFNTNAEKDNLINFLYSKNGFRFITKLFTAINVDCYVVPAKYLPKVDWTRSWTVEEILADYGYTKVEIKEVMEDLKNFKGMDD